MFVLVINDTHPTLGGRMFVLTLVENRPPQGCFFWCKESPHDGDRDHWLCFFESEVARVVYLEPR